MELSPLVARPVETEVARDSDMSDKNDVHKKVFRWGTTRWGEVSITWKGDDGSEKWDSAEFCRFAYDYTQACYDEWADDCKVISEINLPPDVFPGLVEVLCPVTRHPVRVVRKLLQDHHSIVCPDRGKLT